MGLRDPSSVTALKLGPSTPFGVAQAQRKSGLAGSLWLLVQAWYRWKVMRALGSHLHLSLVGLMLVYCLSCALWTHARNAPVGRACMSVRMGPHLQRRLISASP